jgi:hypothetical protein
MAANCLLPLWQVCGGSHYVIVSNLRIQNLVMTELVTLVRLLATLGYNASVRINSLVEFPRFMAVL